MNAGQILEDIVYHLFEGRQLWFDRFYNSIAENVLYKDNEGVVREVDVFAIHHIEGKRRYVVLVECKLSNRVTKATDQLRRAKKHILSEFPNARVFCFYAHDYKAKTKKYKLEWLKGV